MIHKVEPQLKDLIQLLKKKGEKTKKTDKNYRKILKKKNKFLKRSGLYWRSIIVNIKRH